MITYTWNDEKITLKYVEKTLPNFDHLPPQVENSGNFITKLESEDRNLLVSYNLTGLVLLIRIKSAWIYEDSDFSNYHHKYLKGFCPESLFEVQLKRSPSLNMQKPLV